MVRTPGPPNPGRTVPPLTTLAKTADTWAESGSRNVPAARLFQTAALANWSELPIANVVVPALFTVRPSSFEKNPLTVVVPFRFVTPAPDIVPPQASGPETVTVPGPLRVPDWKLNEPAWNVAPAPAVTVPPVTWSVSGRTRVPPGRLFQAAPTARMDVPPNTGSEAVPALFTVRPSTRAKTPCPGNADVPFRFVVPGPVMVPFVQFRLPVTVRVPGPPTVPDWNVNVPTWMEAPALTVSVPPLKSRLATDGLSDDATKPLN